MGKLIVGLPDIHLEKPTKSALCALNFCKENCPEEIVIMGDFLNLSALSTHDKQYPGRILTSFEEDIHQGLLFLDKLLEIGAKITYIFGNHEERCQRYMDESPKANHGMFSIPELMKLKEKDIKWLPYGKAYKVGKAQLTHGHWCNEHSAKKHVEAYGDNIFFGHTHTVQVYSKIKLHTSNPIVGVSCGCLCEVNPSYLHNAPNKWVNAFLILEMSNSGLFSYYTPQIIGGKFSFSGTIYSA